MKNGLQSDSGVWKRKETKKDYDEYLLHWSGQKAKIKEWQRKNIHFRIKIPCSNRQAKFRWFPIFVFAFEARFFVASFHSPPGFFSTVERFFALCRYSIFSTVWNSENFFLQLRTKNIYKTLYNNGGALYNVPIVDKWIFLEIQTDFAKWASSLVNWANVHQSCQKVFELS